MLMRNLLLEYIVLEPIDNQFTGEDLDDTQKIMSGLMLYALKIQAWLLACRVRKSILKHPAIIRDPAISSQGRVILLLNHPHYLEFNDAPYPSGKAAHQPERLEDSPYAAALFMGIQRQGNGGSGIDVHGQACQRGNTAGTEGNYRRA